VVVYARVMLLGCTTMNHTTTKPYTLRHTTTFSLLALNS